LTDEEPGGILLKVAVDRNAEHQVMKNIVAAFLICASIFTIHYAIGAAGTDRPAGVEASNWIPINDRMGFVVMPPAAYPVATPDKQPLLLTPAASGYFMARSSIGWQRLVIVEPMKGPGGSG
jgi:hypothetical protein